MSRLSFFGGGLGFLYWKALYGLLSVVYCYGNANVFTATGLGVLLLPVLSMLTAARHRV